MGKNKTADLLQGALDLLVLRMLQTRPLNGWDIMRRLQLVTGDVLTVTAGSLYPALHRLEGRGLVSRVVAALREQSSRARLSHHRRRPPAARVAARNLGSILRAVDALLRDA